MRGCVVRQLLKLSTLFDWILDCQRRECFAIRRKDRHRGVDTVGAEDVDVDVDPLWTDCVHRSAFGQEHLFGKRDEMRATCVAIQGRDGDKLYRRYWQRCRHWPCFQHPSRFGDASLNHRGRQVRYRAGGFFLNLLNSRQAWTEVRGFGLGLLSDNARANDLLRTLLRPHFKGRKKKGNNKKG